MESFQLFEQEINPNSNRDCNSKREAPFYIHSSESKPKLPPVTSWPKVLGVDKNIAAATMKMISSEPPKHKSTMTRSKTTGDMSQLPHAGTASTNGKPAKSGWRRPSYLKAQEEVLANEPAISAERRARAIAAAQRNARRSGIGIRIGNGMNPINPTTAGSAPISRGKMQPPPPPATKHAPRHSLPPPRNSSASNSASTSAGTSTSGEMLKRVFSESVRSVRRIGRSFTGLSGSGEG
jgi:hypothetical protein